MFAHGRTHSGFRKLGVTRSNETILRLEASRAPGALLGRQHPLRAQALRRPRGVRGLFDFALEPTRSARALAVRVGFARARVRRRVAADFAWRDKAVGDAADLPSFLSAWVTARARRDDLVRGFRRP